METAAVMERMPLVITTCSARKTRSVEARPYWHATRSEHPGRAWFELLQRCEQLGPARDLYAGRGFRIVRDAADQAGAEFAILSAGLGLIAGETQVPSYDFTISPAATPDNGPPLGMSARAWGRELSCSPYAMNFESQITSHPVTLIALSRKYAEMLAPTLETLEDRLLTRLRILGLGIAKALPATAHCAILPYNEEIASLSGGGIRADFASRALALHLKDRADWDLEREKEEVARMPKVKQAPIERLQVTDDIILGEIAMAPKDTSPTSMVRRLRESGIACGTQRLSRLMTKREAGHG